MSKKRRRFSPDFKFRVALEAAKGQRTLSQLSSDYSVHPNQISQWKRQLLENGADMFSQNGAKEYRDQEAVQTELYEEIGWWKMQSALLVVLLLVSQLLAARPAAAQSLIGDVQKSNADEVRPDKAGGWDGVGSVAKIHEDDYLDLIEAIAGTIQDGDSEALEMFLQDQVDTQRVLEEGTIRIVIQLVAVGAVLLGLLPGTSHARSPKAANLFTQQPDCGSVDGISLPCDWDEYLSDGEGDESLPYYPYAKRPNGCSVPRTSPGSNDTINLFSINISFTDICNAHDRCYYTLGTTPSQCNEPFESGLRARCEKEIAEHADNGWDIVTLGVSRATALETCYTKAEAMAVAVIGAQKIFHPVAQKRQQKYLDRVNAYVENACLEEEQAKAALEQID